MKKIEQVEIETHVAQRSPNHITNLEISPWRSFSWPREQLDPLNTAMWARLRVSVYDYPDFEIYSVYNPEALLSGKNFENLLSGARREYPHIYSQGRQGILDDWVIIDRNSSLLHMHTEGLGAHWRTFMKGHKQRFVNALSLTPEDQMRNFFQRQLERLASPEQARRLQNDAELSLRSGALYYQSSEFKSVNGVLAFDQLPDTVQKELKNGVRKEVLANKIIIDPESRPRRVVWGGGDGIQYSITHLKLGLILIESASSYTIVGVNGDQPNVIDQYIEKGDRVGLIPRTVWIKTKRKGERLYWDREVPKHLKDGVDPRTDTLAGLLWATYLSPNERDTLPLELGLPGGHHKQFMREAQMPVLVLIYRDRILRGRFVHQIERCIQDKDYQLISVA